MGKIFISYSRKDLKKVIAIKEEIVATTGAECWMDLEDIEAGSYQFIKNIIAGIESCEVLLFMLSQNSQISKFSLRELNYASKRAEEDRSKHIVIVNIDGCKMVPEFEFMYGLTDTILWTDIAQHDKLLRDLKNWLGTEADTLKEVKEDKDVEVDKVVLYWLENASKLCLMGNYKESFNLYMEAAKSGNADGMYAVATFYHKGLYVPRDLKQAYIWYKMAAMKGHVQAIEALKIK